MNRRARVVALIGMLLMLGLGIGAVLPAMGDTPEGGDCGTINVTPSDGLPLSSAVTVTGANFDVCVEGTAKPVSVAQCLSRLEGCGPQTVFTPIGGRFSGTIVVVRMLTIGTSTVDCAEETCEVWANGSGFAAHHLTFAPRVTTTLPPVILDPTTTVKPVPTTAPPTTIKGVTTSVPPPTSTPTTPTTKPGTPTTLKSAPGATVPPTTKPGSPTTTVRPSSTTSSSVPPPTTTVPPPPPPGGDVTTLIAVTSKNEPAGPPGGGLHVQGHGYTCPTVYFFFDRTRVGSDSPDAAGNVSKGGLSVPGDAGKGPHQVTASCDASGDTVVQASSFEVLPVSVHRPAFVTSLPLPSQVNFDAGGILTSAAVAVGAIMLIAFPFELFNSTMEENYDEIRAWFGLGPRKVPDPKAHGHVWQFLALTAASALACGFLSPDFGLNMTSLVLFVGMFVALIVMAVVFSIPADIGIRRQYGEWGKLNFLPGSVIVSIVLVLASRVLHFQPGYFYGALAGLAFRSALTERVQGKMTAANWVFSLIVSVGAFFLRVPVSAAAAKPGRSIWWIGVEICLALIFLWGVEGLAVAMLPMRFLDGRKVLRWSKPAWAALFFLGIFATVHVLLRPGSGYVGSTTGDISIGVMSLFVAFGVGSVAFWAYFRFRPDRWVPVKAAGVSS